MLERIGQLSIMKFEDATVEPYSKYETQLMTVLTSSELLQPEATLQDVRTLFDRIGKPIFSDSYSREDTSTLELMFDSRKQVSRIPELFWVHLFAEASSG